MITSTQIRKTEIFAFIDVLVFKLLGRKVFSQNDASKYDNIFLRVKVTIFSQGKGNLSSDKFGATKVSSHKVLLDNLV